MDNKPSFWQWLLSLLGNTPKDIKPTPAPTEPPPPTPHGSPEEQDEAAAFNDISTSLWRLENKVAEAEELTTASELPEALTRDVTRDTSNRVTIPRSRPGQLLNLSDPNHVARFDITDRIWPSEYGQPSICLWSQDKLAAFSLTIDDNHVEDHPFWLQMAQQFGWKWTWFIIVNKVGWIHENWSDWQSLLNKGHDIQSHTYSHLCDALLYTQREYLQAINLMNARLQGAQPVTLAYPFGFKTNKAGSPCECIKRSQNDRAEAAKYHLAARDVVGAITPINKVDFMKVPSVSAYRNFFNANAHWAFFDSILDKNSRNWRSWYCGHMHHVPTENAKNEVRKVLQHVKSKEADVWVGTFTQVVKYAQEYATARLDNVRSRAGEIRFELKDEMYDQWFDEPLTIKCRLEADWQGRAQATQNGQAIPVKVVQHQGAHFALVDAIPDRGLVTVKRA